MEDKDLVLHFTNSNGRDLSAYNSIVKKYEAIVFGSCIRYLRNKESAEEVTQEVFLKVYSKLETLKNPEQLKSWILRIATNTCSDHYHKRKRAKEIKDRVQVEIETHAQHSADYESDNTESEALQLAISKLNDQDREVIMLHYFSGLKIDEIASSLGFGESAVKMRLHRSRDKILQFMRGNSDR